MLKSNLANEGQLTHSTKPNIPIIEIYLYFDLNVIYTSKANMIML